jgi:hypothetical protein
VRFSDRERVEAILDRAKSAITVVRGLVHAIIQSDLFRSK